MSKRNFYFGGFSLLVTGAAIAGGAAVSSSAMADSGTPTDDLNTVHVISVNEGGEAIECEYDGIDFPSFVVNDTEGSGVIAVTGSATIADGVPEGQPPALEAHALSEDGATISVSVGADGTLTDSEGNVIEPGTVVSGSNGTITVGEGELVPLTPEQMAEMVPMQVISADDARPGTPEECAAMQPTPAVPADTEG
jgi:hypothetical protein